MMANGIKLMRRVGTGSSTNAGKRKQNTEKRRAWWKLVKNSASLVGRISMGKDGLMVIVCVTTGADMATRIAAVFWAVVMLKREGG